MIRPFGFRPASFAIVLAASALAADPASRGPVTRVEDVLGVPTFTPDGAPFLLPTFETYAPGDRTFAQFAGTGTRVFMFNTNAAACDYGHSAPTWPAPETFDYRQLDERARMVLRASWRSSTTARRCTPNPTGTPRSRRGGPSPASPRRAGGRTCRAGSAP
ncbi:MAG: hypothetical protein JXP34_08825 [Planctomycetes bacterium]|nr:hypothetical protein [Planctomycetota bacterium]